MLDFFDKDIDFTDVFICRECSEIRGPWKSHGEVFRQRCRCEEATLAEPDETWLAFDFNRLCELCYCCGAELVESGFESSVWFCGECKQRIEKLNEEHGQCVIPMGRFDDADRGAVVSLNSPMRWIVRDTLLTCRFSEAEEVSMARYLEVVAEGPVDKTRAFGRFYSLLRLNADGTD